MLKLTDWYTEDLFDADEEHKIIAPFSRIFCDAERFTDDSQEVMAQYGMGVLYERTDDGRLIRHVTADLKERVIREFYMPHHNKLNEAVNHELEVNSKALIIDCHSYPSKPLQRDLNKQPNRPDFNIGTDIYHTPPYLVDASKAFFEKAGYSLGIDWPYTGSIVPMQHFRNNKNVESIMLEINRSLYLNEPGNEKTENYENIKAIAQDYLQTIKQCFCNS